MADEDTKTEVDQVADEVNTEVAETAEAETKVAPEPSESEKKLTEQIGDLQGKFDTLSQDASKNKQLLEEITPFVNWDGMKAERSGGEQATADDDETDQTFLTKKEAKDLEQRISQKIKTSEFQRDFRTKYSDLGDKGPKEELVRFYFENKTSRTDSFDKRLEVAVKATRDLLKSEQDIGAEKTKTDEEKAAQEVKAKTEAAAKASGLSSAGITSPKASESKDTETASDYVASRKERLDKLRTGR